MKDKVIYGIFAVLVIAVVILFFRLSSVSEDRDRLAENQLSMIEGINNIVLSNSEMKEYLKSRDKDLLKSMSDSIGAKIRVNNLNHYSTVTNTYKDTTLIELPMTFIDNAYPFEYKDSCWGVKGIFDINESKLNITERSSSNTVVRIDYVKREPVKWLFGLRVGKKKAGVYVESTCGNAETMEIEVQ